MELTAGAIRRGRSALADIDVLQTKIVDVLWGRGKGSNSWEKDFASTTVEHSGGETVTTTDELNAPMHDRPGGLTWQSDRRDMGYPFDRTLSEGVSATVAAHDNMAWRTITIRCRIL
jgi:hypothetical protein